MAKHVKSAVAAFITERIEQSSKSQKDIAGECGWPKPNVISMLKKGHMRLPLDKVGPLAKALQVDPALLFWLVLTEYAPETQEALTDSLYGSVVLDPYERRLIIAFRMLVGDHTDRPVKILDGRKSIDVALVDLG